MSRSQWVRLFLSGITWLPFGSSFATSSGTLPSELQNINHCIAVIEHKQILSLLINAQPMANTDMDVSTLWQKVFITFNFDTLNTKLDLHIVLGGRRDLSCEG